MKFTERKVNLRILFIILILQSISLLILFARKQDQLATVSSGTQQNQSVFPLVATTRNSDLQKPKTNKYFWDLTSENEYQISSKLTIFDNGSLFVKELIGKTIYFVQVLLVLPNDWLVVVKNISDQFRLVFLKSIRLSLPEPHSSLVVGMVLGNISGMSKELKHYLKIIGMLHVVSASGYNISLLISLIKPVIQPFFSKKIQTVLYTLFIWLYSLVAGLGPSIIRACIMSSLSLIVPHFLHRQYKSSLGLIFAFVTMILVNPNYISSLSFQLSVAATSGIIWLHKLFFVDSTRLADQVIGVISLDRTVDKYPFFSRIVSLFRESFTITFVVLITTFPLVAHNFGEFSLMSLVANTLLLWLTPLITISGLLLGVISMGLSFFPLVFGAVMPLLSLFVWLLGELFLSGVRFLGKFDQFVIPITVGITKIMYWWTGLIIILVIRNKLKERPNF